jgi:predicted acyltransferase
MVDEVAPVFIIAIGMSFIISYKKRIATCGQNETSSHFLKRFAVLIGIGAILVSGERIFAPTGSDYAWGVLQAIGVAGIATTLTIRLPAVARICIGIVSLAAYQVFLDFFWLNIVLSSSHGGLPGSLSWTAMMILAASIAELIENSKRSPITAAAAGGILTISGLITGIFIPISKNRVSASYVLLSTGIGILLLSCFMLLSGKARLRLSFLVVWGKNPLLFYILHYILLGIVFLPGVPWWYGNAAPWLVVFQLCFLIGCMSVLAFRLDMKKLIVHL